MRFNVWAEFFNMISTTPSMPREQVGSKSEICRRDSNNICSKLGNSLGFLCRWAKNSQARAHVSQDMIRGNTDESDLLVIVQTAAERYASDQRTRECPGSS